jgi:rhodanese-related sulfurtransferase
MKGSIKTIFLCAACCALGLIAGFAAARASDNGPITQHRALSSSAELAALLSDTSFMKEGPLLVDLRDRKDYEQGHIPGFVNVSNAREGEPLATWVAPFRRDKPIVLICYSGNRSARAFESLVLSGFTRVIDYTKGYADYAAGMGEGYSPETGACDCPK